MPLLNPVEGGSRCGRTSRAGRRCGCHSGLWTPFSLSEQVLRDCLHPLRYDRDPFVYSLSRRIRGDGGRSGHSSCANRTMERPAERPARRPILSCERRHRSRSWVRRLAGFLVTERRYGYRGTVSLSMAFRVLAVEPASSSPTQAGPHRIGGGSTDMTSGPCFWLKSTALPWMPSKTRPTT